MDFQQELTILIGNLAGKQVDKGYDLGDEIEKVIEIRDSLAKPVPRSRERGISLTKFCHWFFDSNHEKWDTGCDKAFQLITGEPSDNGIEFCPYCGKRIATPPEYLKGER